MVLVRKYKDYDAYVAHQVEKLGRVYPIIGAHDYRRGTLIVFDALFKQVIKKCLNRKIGGRLLCLGARLGEEVVAWQNLGFDAIGIDLNPGPNNKFVIKGDFHNLEFEDESFDYVFSNSVDHVLYIDKFNKECHRVLKKGGKALFEVRPHQPESVLDDIKKDGTNAGNPWCESFYWETQEELVKLFKNFNTWEKIEYYDFRVMNVKIEKFTNLRPFMVLTK
jgi:SAM-dependent methyltransferase